MRFEGKLNFRDGPDECTFVGIDVSGDFLEQAKANLLTACPKLREERVELIQATYMEGVREARKRSDPLFLQHMLLQWSTYT